MKCLIFILIVSIVIVSCKKEEPVPEPQTIEQQDTTTSANELNLLSHFGETSSPNSADSICAISPYLGDFDANAISIGNSVHDFTLYDENGLGYNLENMLQDGKPVFIMTGSYTCPVFRNSISEINQLVTDYGSEISFFIAYTVEAHPIVDNSPYADSVWTTQQNYNANVLYEQPKTYGERVAIVNDLKANYSINCPVLIDNKCNEFWTYYGEAPNRAYLINDSGTVQISHGWFDYPSMVNSLDIFLAE